MSAKDLLSMAELVRYDYPMVAEHLRLLAKQMTTPEPGTDGGRGVTAAREDVALSESVRFRPVPPVPDETLSHTKPELTNEDRHHIGVVLDCLAAASTPPPPVGPKFAVGEQVAWTGAGKSEHTGVVSAIQPRTYVVVADGTTGRFPVTFDESELRAVLTKGCDAG